MNLNAVFDIDIALIDSTLLKLSSAAAAVGCGKCSLKIRRLNVDGYGCLLPLCRASPSLSLPCCSSRSPSNVQRFLFCCQKPHCHSRAERGAGRGSRRGRAKVRLPRCYWPVHSKEMRKEKQPTHPNLSSTTARRAPRDPRVGSRELARPEPEVFGRLIPKPSQSKTRLFIRKKHPEISNPENAS